MPNDYEVNVIITEHPEYWAWKVECLGQFVASGSAVSLERALRIARQYGCNMPTSLSCYFATMIVSFMKSESEEL